MSDTACNRAIVDGVKRAMYLEYQDRVFVEYNAEAVVNIDESVVSQKWICPPHILDRTSASDNTSAAGERSSCKRQPADLPPFGTRSI